MSKELFNILLADYIPQATLVDLRGFGESLLLPDFDWYVEQTARVCRHIRLTTTLGCGTQKALQALVDHDVFVSVSFDAADKTRYESIRPGIQYETVIQNLEFLSRKMRQKHGGLKGRMRLGIVPLQKLNLKYVAGVIDLAARLEIPEIRIMPLGSHIFDFNTLFYHQRQTIETLLEAVRSARQKGITMQFGIPLIAKLRLNDKIFDCCCKPWLYAVVNHEGQMLYCDWHIAPWDRSRDFLGSIREPAAAVWNGSLAQQVRQLHTGSKGSCHRRCQLCYRLGRYCDHEHEIDSQFIPRLVTDREMEARLAALSKG